MSKTILFSLCYTLISFHVAAAQTETLAKYFQENEKGWFWYESLPKETQQKIQQAIEKVLTPNNPPPLSPAWFRENYQLYLDNAQQNPHDPEAMRTYLYLEKYIRDQAEIFAYQRQAMVYADPFLDSSSQRGMASFAAQSMTQDANHIQKELLGKLGDKLGIYFFYRSDCHYCHQQAPLVELLKRRYNFTVIPVSLDGKPLKNSTMKNFLIDKGQSTALNVTVVPALFIFDGKNKTTIGISQGLQSLNQIEQRILYAANRQGYISDELLNQTRGKGLYSRLDGSKKTVMHLPDDAPQTFITLYQQSLHGNAYE